MKNNGNTQGQRLKERRTQGCKGRFSDSEQEPGGAENFSSLASDNSERLNRSDWRWGNPFGTFSGEVINRLILQAEERLRSFDESIEWYEKQSEKLKYELEELKELRQLHLQLAEEAEQSHQLTEEE